MKKYLIIALAAIGDAVTTIVAVNSKEAYEANPIAKAFQDSIGLVGANIITAICFFIFITSLYSLAEKSKPLFKLVFNSSATGILIFKILVVTFNIVFVIVPIYFN